MSLFRELHDPRDLSDRLRATQAVSVDLISDVIDTGVRQCPSPDQLEKTAQIERLIRSKAWTDAALALIDLQLPLWHLRRIVYDEGEWHCALSRQRELPDWLDRSVEAHHADLSLALLSACVDARHLSEAAIQTSGSAVSRNAGSSCEPVCCDNFG